MIITFFTVDFLATTFLEMWKRRQAILKWEWDLSDDEDVEEIRPEFEANVKSRRYAKSHTGLTTCFRPI